MLCITNSFFFFFFFLYLLGSYGFIYFMISILGMEKLRDFEGIGD